MSNHSVLNTDCKVYPGQFIPSINLYKIKNKIAHHTSSIIKKPKVNMAESNELIKVEMSIPGVRREDFYIVVEDNKLSVFVDHNESQDKSSETYKLKEFEYKRYIRHLALPEHADIPFISAEYHDGILKLVIPKTKANQLKHNHKIIVY